jgi:CubicO group peptidase (beta-lactamase class C family)
MFRNTPHGSNRRRYSQTLPYEDFRQRYAGLGDLFCECLAADLQLKINRMPTADKPIATIPNPDLEVIDGNKSRWTQADHRRYGFHNLYRIARYGMSFRAARVLPLETRIEPHIAELKSVRELTSLPWFSAMIVLREQHILFERYASDFGKNSPHSVQSITKTLLNLMVGQLIERGVLDLDQAVIHYVPEIGSGYANATIQEVLNMDVVNDYTQDYADPGSTYYRHEEAMGWRLPKNSAQEEMQRSFLCRVSSDDTGNRSGHALYKDANTDVLGWVVERASGRSLRSFLADIVDAAGLEDALHITTDRDGVPTLDGGACLTARDLARYWSLFIRRGRGVQGESVGGRAFIDTTVSGGVPMPPPYQGINYSNHMMVLGRSLGHAGWGGQYALANLDTGTIAIFFSVIENQHGTTREFIRPVIDLLESIAKL